MTNSRCSYDITLDRNEMPKQWYNFMPDLPDGLPAPKNDGDGIPQTEKMRKIRPAILLEQDTFPGEFIDIPQEISDYLVQIGRPTPLRRAVALERHLDTPAKIYYKREDTIVTGSFKMTTAIAQAYYCKQAGYKHVLWQWSS